MRAYVEERSEEHSWLDQLETTFGRKLNPKYKLFRRERFVHQESVSFSFCGLTTNPPQPSEEEVS